MNQRAQAIREQILELAGEYAVEAFAPAPFVPGQSPVPVSGKVFDGSEVALLVDSALDFWLTTGRFAAQFERAFARLIGVRNCSLTWRKRRRADERTVPFEDAEDALPTALPADVVILNPPRAGVDARVTAALEAARASTRAIVYVSCDPATLARDVGRLGGWRIASLESFDMFPQTAHVETVCELIPES